MSTTGDEEASPLAVQIVIDCAEPHVLADWWAETLSWEVEPQDATFIEEMIAQGRVSRDDTLVHKGALVFADGAAVRPPSPGRVGQARIYFQQVAEPKAVKNRIHLDLRPEPGQPLASFHERLVDRGAVVVAEGEQGPHRWLTYADPEGNEFCLTLPDEA